jgi:hypothetical protein
MLKKTNQSRGGQSEKFLLPCKDLQQEPEWLNINNHLSNQQYNILLATIDNRLNVVVKYDEPHSIQHEYEIGERACSNKVPNFIKYLHRFISDDQKRGMLVMPYYHLGNFEDMRWDRMSFHTMICVAKQVVYSLLYAYEKFGFVHGDMHLGNVLIRKTKKTVVSYGDNITIPTNGSYAIIMDFGRSFVVPEDKRNEQMAWVYEDIYRFLHIIQCSANSDIVMSQSLNFLRDYSGTSRPIDKELYSEINNMVDEFKISYCRSEIPKINWRV